MNRLVLHLLAKRNMDSRLWAFVLVTAVLTVTPGADTALVLRSSVTRGRPAALLTVWGIATGCLVHATASALGLSVILRQSAEMYQTVKLAGALYLVWLGIQSMRAAWRSGIEMSGVEKRVQEAGRRSFTEGLLTNLLNPKVALFYLTFLPQFVSPDGSALLQSLTLALVHVAMGVVWLSFVALLIDRISPWLRRSSFRRGMEATTGVLLAGLGVRLAMDNR